MVVGSLTKRKELETCICCFKIMYYVCIIEYKVIEVVFHWNRNYNDASYYH